MTSAHMMPRCNEKLASNNAKHFFKAVRCRYMTVERKRLVTPTQSQVFTTNPTAEHPVQLTHCCDGGSLVEDVSGAHILDGLGINSLSQEGKVQ